MSESKILEIHLKALSPISVTEKVYGILYKTYRFIPAWTMWNSLVKLYAIINWDNSKKEGNYTEAQKKLESIRLTNFYPTVKIKENNNEKERLYIPTLPIQDNENKNEIVINRIDEKEIVSSDLKVSIDPLTNTSEYGQLYEREYLTAKKFIGLIRVEDEDLEEFFKEKIKNQILFIGADKNTGFGKLTIENILENKENFLIKSSSLLKKIENPEISSFQYSYLLPVEMDEKHIFPLVLKTYDENRGSGMKIKCFLSEGDLNDRSHL